MTAMPDSLASPSIEETSSPRRGRVVVWLVVICAVCLGVAERAWFVFHRPVTSDSAVVGLMAQQVLHGHFSVFYWGEYYGGGETYIVALLFAIAGASTWALETTPMLMSVIAAGLTWRCAKRFVPDPALAALAGALVWAGSETSVSTSTVEYGFRGLTLVAGLCLLLFSLRIIDGDRGWPTFLALGLAAGVGWWASPEIVYLAVPAGIVLAVAIARDTRWALWLRRGAVAVIAAAVGGLPWLWANVDSGFRSLNTRSFAVPPHNLDYTARLHDFFVYSLPILLDLRRSGQGRWLFGADASIAVLVVFLVAIVLALALCIARGGRYLALAVGVVAFPFLLAVSPGSWYWNDGRYADYAVPLLALVAAAGTDSARRLLARRREPAVRSRRTGRLVFAVATAALIAFGAADFSTLYTPHQSYLSAWRNPSGPAEQSVLALERAGVRYGYADYWVAYDIDFLSGGRLQISPVGTDLVRSPSLLAEVMRSKTPAWLFVRPLKAALESIAATRAIRGPDGLVKHGFLADLRRLGVRFSIVNADLITAVIPDPAVQRKQLG